MNEDNNGDWFGNNNNHHQQQKDGVVPPPGGIESALMTLQPIRDLAKNWDIDIATCLDEYLVDLEFSQETREHIVNHATTTTNNMNFNFTQAAMVLQNSSGIYSRKVDYLHTYVYKIQDELISTINNNNQNGTMKGSMGNNKKNSVGIDHEIEEFLNFDPHQEFLPLNDVIPTCDVNEYKNKINLQFTDTDNINLDSTVLTPSTRRRSSILDSVSRRRYSNRMSMGSTTLFFDQTMMTEAGNNSTMLHVAARNALLGTLDTTGTLRLQSGVCDIGEDGILRIPGSSSQERAVENIQLSNNANGISSQDDDNDFEARIDDDDDDDHGGFVMANDDTDNENLIQNNVPNPQEKTKRVTFSDTSLPTAPLKPKENLKNDPWALLDRDATNVRKPRPLRIGKTIVLPETVDKPPSECVTGARTRRTARIKTERIPRVKMLQSLSSSVDTSDNVFSFGIGKKRSLEKNQLNLNLNKPGLGFGDEFAYIAKDVAKYQAENRRELRLRRNKELQSLEANTETIKDKDGFVGTFGGQFHDEDDDDFDYPEDNGVDLLSDDAPAESNTGIKSLSDIYQNRDNEADTETNTDSRTFEELCRAHIAAFARGAEKYAAETKLSARVGEWQGKLLPLLEEEDRRPVFDIHQYGDTVIQNMEKQIRKDESSYTNNTNMTKSTKVVAFSEITRDCQPFDVCRMFLAALSLNNSGNIQFTNDSVLNSLKVELINPEIENPMETYLAPSVEESVY